METSVRRWCQARPALAGRSTSGANSGMNIVRDENVPRIA